MNFCSFKFITGLVLISLSLLSSNKSLFVEASKKSNLRSSENAVEEVSAIGTLGCANWCNQYTCAAPSCFSCNTCQNQGCPAWCNKDLYNCDYTPQCIYLPCPACRRDGIDVHSTSKWTVTCYWRGLNSRQEIFLLYTQGKNQFDAKDRLLLMATVNRFESRRMLMLINNSNSI